MTRRHSPLLAKGICPWQEKDSNIEWWSEKGERGEMEEVKDEGREEEEDGRRSRNGNPSHEREKTRRKQGE